MGDPLHGNEEGSFAALGRSRTAYRTGTGPAVIVTREVAGVTPLFAGFGRTVAARGLTAVLPHLFGRPGEEPPGRAIARPMAQVCVSRELTLLPAGCLHPHRPPVPLAQCPGPTAPTARHLLAQDPDPRPGAGPDLAAGPPSAPAASACAHVYT